MLLNIPAMHSNVTGMKNFVRICAAGLVLGLAGPAFAADCYADYKAKQQNPLRLHYGVVALQGNCNKSDARQEIAQRIAADGWVLLNVLSVFDASGLAKRQGNAGQFYLRY